MIKPNHQKSKLVILAMFVSVFLVSGCSLIPRLTFDRPGTVPQKTVKSEKDYFHKSKDGEVTKTREVNYVQQERKLTFREQITNFFANLKGLLFWIVIGLVFLCPSALSWILSSVFSVTRQAIESIVTAIQTAKNTDGNYQKAIDNECAKNPRVKALIDKINKKIASKVPQNPTPAPAPITTATVVPSDTPPPSK